MEKDLKQLFVDGADFDLCNEVFLRILRLHGDNIDAAKLSEPERVVLLAWHASGVIGNGGFNYLFEGNIKGDPHFALTARSYQEIGCRACAEAFGKALALFPQSKPPAEIGKRLEQYRRGDGKLRGEIDLLFFAGNKQIHQLLASYVRAHRNDYRQLEDALPERVSEPKPEPEPPDPNSLFAGLDRLPHWKRVALAARCARLALPEFRASWPNALPKRLQAVTHAVELVEESAADGQPVDGLKNAKLEAVMAAGAALGTDLYGIPKDEPAPPNGNAASRAAAVAKVVEHAVRAALAPPDDSTIEVLRAWNYAADLASEEEWQGFLSEVTPLLGVSEIQTEGPGESSTVGDTYSEQRTMALVACLAGGLMSLWRTWKPEFQPWHMLSDIYLLFTAGALWLRWRWDGAILAGAALVIIGWQIVHSVAAGRVTFVALITFAAAGVALKWAWGFHRESRP